MGKIKYIFPQKYLEMKLVLCFLMAAVCAADSIAYSISSIQSNTCDSTVCTLLATMSDANGENDVSCRFLFSKDDGVILDSECEEKQISKRRWSQNDFFYHPI